MRRIEPVPLSHTESGTGAARGCVGARYAYTPINTDQDGDLAYEWDGDELYVYAEDEQTVDELLERVSSDDGGAAEGSAGVDGAELLGDLFVAADRLQHDGTDNEGTFRMLESGRVVEEAAAPYGMDKPVWEGLQERIVRGENIGQTLQFIATGNAELGFVALSQVIDGAAGGAWLVVPEDLHAPIVQEAILLDKGRSSPAAKAFLGVTLLSKSSVSVSTPR